MAVCPQCGSSHITLKRDTDINWGRALVGWAAFGVVGGAVAGVTGQDRNAVTCLDCGATWRAADIHKAIQIIKEATGYTLDLTIEAHRKHLGSFIDKTALYLQELCEVERVAIKLVADAKKHTTGPAAANISCLGCLGWVVIITVLTFSGLINAPIFMICSMALAVIPYLGVKIDKSNGWTHEKAVCDAEKQAAKLRADARESVLAKIRAFTKANPLEAAPPEIRSAREIPRIPPPLPPPPPPARQFALEMKPDLLIEERFGESGVSKALKMATEFKKGGNLEAAIAALKTAYKEAEDSSTVYGIKTFLRLPALLQDAGLNDEAWEFLNLLLTKGYPNQISNQSIRVLENSEIYSSMRKFLDREKKYRKALAYGVLSLAARAQYNYLQAKEKDWPDEIKEDRFKIFTLSSEYEAIRLDVARMAKKVAASDSTLDKVAKYLCLSLKKPGLIDYGALLKEVDAILAEPEIGV